MTSEEKTKEIIDKIVEDPEMIYKKNRKIFSNREVVLAAAKRNPIILGYVDESLRNDRELFKTGLATTGWVLVAAGDKLRKDPSIVLLAIDKSGADVLECVNEELRNDVDFMKKAVAIDGMALKYAGKDVVKEKEIILEAFKTNKFALRYADKFLKNDKELALIAAQKDCLYVFDYISDRLKNDPEVALIAIRENGLCFLDVGDDLVSNNVLFEYAKLSDKKRVEYYEKVKAKLLSNTITR